MSFRCLIPNLTNRVAKFLNVFQSDYSFNCKGSKLTSTISIRHFHPNSPSIWGLQAFTQCRYCGLDNIKTDFEPIHPKKEQITENGIFLRILTLVMTFRNDAQK